MRCGEASEMKNEQKMKCGNMEHDDRYKTLF